MKLRFIAAALALAAALPAHAVLVNNAAAIPSPIPAINFDAFDGFITTGPEPVGNGIMFTGDQGSELGAFIADLGNNGLWGAGNSFVAGGAIGELRFTLADGFFSSGGGALVNHVSVPGFPFSMVISAYGENNQIIETHTFSVSTGVNSLNQGLFAGIVRPQADIRAISFKGNSVVLDNLVFATPVPEPGTAALMLAGLAVAGFMAGRRRG